MKRQTKGRIREKSEFQSRRNFATTAVSMDENTKAECRNMKSVSAKAIMRGFWIGCGYGLWEKQQKRANHDLYCENVSTLWTHS